MNYTTPEFEFERAIITLQQMEVLKRLIFWQETFSANSTILEIIDKGYKIHFLKYLKVLHFAITNLLKKIRFYWRIHLEIAKICFMTKANLQNQ